MRVLLRQRSSARCGASLPGQHSQLYTLTIDAADACSLQRLRSAPRPFRATPKTLWLTADHDCRDADVTQPGAGKAVWDGVSLVLIR